MTVRLLERVLESPGWKTFFGVIIPVVVGVLSGAFIAEISSENTMNWLAFYKAKSFYGLLAISAVTFIYHRAVYLYERRVERFVNDDYCRAYMRSKCLPEAAEKYRELIRAGQIGELSTAMEEFERIMK